MILIIMLLMNGLKPVRSVELDQAVRTTLYSMVNVNI